MEQNNPDKPSRIITSTSKRVDNLPFAFRHCTPLQIRFSDIDIFGHVNNSVYSSMVDVGKIRYFKAVMGNLDFNNLGIVVADIHFSFIEPTHLSDPIEVWTTTTAIGTHSFHLEQRIIDSLTGHVKCVARSVMCAISRDGQSAPLPQVWVDSLESYEERNINRYSSK